MARRTQRLSTAKVKHAKVGLHPDGGGLYLQVTTGKDGHLNKSWLFRFAIDCHERRMGLGPLHTIGLGEARDAATEARKLLLAGRDPIEVRTAGRTATAISNAKLMSFTECAVAYMAAHEAGWRNAKHRHQWRSSLETYAYPILGKLPVAEIDTALVMKVIQPVWTAKPETASRVRNRIEMILDWATTSGYRKGDNPARWKAHIEP
jgi:hypothetical protein